MPRQALPLFLLMALTQLGAQAPMDSIQHAPDGSSQLRIQSIEIPAIANAPFSAIVVTELIRLMPDGTKAITWNHRFVARDSSGRIFQERRWFVPRDNVAQTQLSELQYDDPNLGEMMLCEPLQKICRVYGRTYNAQLPAQDASLPATLTMRNGNTIQNESLGHNTIESLDCIGSRETMTIPAGAIGNEKPQPVVKEFWYAPALGINLLTKRSDPRISSIQNFSVTQLRQVEPDAKTFAAPDGYTVLRVR